MSFGIPITFSLQQLIDVDFNDKQIKGTSENKEVFEIGYRRLSEKEDYLNGIYK